MPAGAADGCKPILICREECGVPPEAEKVIDANMAAEL
jgi:hypothetical protein